MLRMFSEIKASGTGKATGKGGPLMLVSLNLSGEVARIVWVVTPAAIIN